MYKYYNVLAKCGHVGKTRCVWVNFAVAAEDAKEAARKCRYYKRVKHDHTNAIGEVNEITFEQFMMLRAENDSDPYLKCKNIQQQNKIEGMEKRIQVDEWQVERFEKRDKKGKPRCPEYKHKKGKIHKKQVDKAIREYLSEADPLFRYDGGDV